MDRGKLGLIVAVVLAFGGYFTYISLKVKSNKNAQSVNEKQPNLTEKVVANYESFTAGGAIKFSNLESEAKKMEQTGKIDEAVDAYNFLAYAYHSSLNYPKYIEFSKKAYQLFNPSLSKLSKSKKDAVILNAARGAFNNQDYQGAIDILVKNSPLREETEGCLNSDSIGNIFFILELGYIFALKGDLGRAKNIVETCEPQFIKGEKVPKVFRKNLNLYAALIYSKLGIEAKSLEHLNTYIELTPAELSRDLGKSSIVRICSDYAWGKADVDIEEELGVFENVVEQMQDEESGSNYLAMSSALTELVTKSIPIPQAFGHWSEFCKKNNN